MASSLIAGLGGLRAHQNWLDVIGNNLANSNTPGFKTSRALFGDLLSRTLSVGTPPIGTIGGKNPSQIGLGVELRHVDRFFGQGPLDLTGRTFDLALVGRGFFALQAPDRTMYTRVGNFGLDADHTLVDLDTGYKVLDGVGATMTVDVDQVLPPQATSTLTIGGNLPAEVTGPLAEVLTSTSSFQLGTNALVTGTASGTLTIPAGETWTMQVRVDGGAPETVSITGDGSPLTMAQIAAEIDQIAGVSATVGGSGGIEIESGKKGTKSMIKVDGGAVGADLASALGFSTSLVVGSESPATGSTDLNDLTVNAVPYADGDTLEIAGTDADAAPILASFTYGAGNDGTTIDDLVAFLSAEFPEATATFNGTTGQLVLTADTAGEAELSLVITDGSSQVGGSDWAVNSMGTTTDGTGPDTVTSSVEVWDGAGVSRLLTLTYERQEDATWNLTATLDADEGVVVAGQITGITFSESGALLTPTTSTITVQWNGQPPQDLSLDLGVAGTFDGLTQFGGDATASVRSQDGFGAGELASIQVSPFGSIEGFYTNGQTSTLGTLGVATFANEGGLEELGDNLWGETAASGLRTLGTGLTGGAGEVIGGALEQSNVDTTEQFVHLIQAQRGFQASARVITTQDQLLEEVVNIV